LDALARERRNRGSGETGADWRGRSGNVHRLTTLPLGAFSLEPGWLYVLAASSRVLWVGDMDGLVGAAVERQNFREALDRADSAYAIAAPMDEVARMTLAWDLEGAEPAISDH
jgi:hypothetical protein